MARDGAVYACQSCGAVHTKWSGQCAGCGAWNSLVEEVQSRPPGALAPARSAKARGLSFEGLQSDTPSPLRLATGLEEFDRVCGGGVVPGSAILLAGDPGVGKSTLLLQACAAAAARGAACAYISGEEAVEQIRARALRMGLAESPVKLAAETSLRDILDGLKRERFDFVVVDSVQTLWSDAHEAGPGSVTQVRAATGELVRLAKRSGVAIVLVGHVTKDGSIAGPRVLEHMVDTVLSFEGERSHLYRILRAVKNRFGGTDEIGVFAMAEKGLEEVANPSALFLTQRGDEISGATVFPAMEGTRPVLVEIQALVVRLASGATPRRAVVGWDNGRLAMVLAVLEARCGLSFSTCEVYLNVSGGYRIADPGADLAVAAALISALAERPIPADTVAFGEIALSGEVRGVAHAPLRLKEAAKLGFGKAMLPASSRDGVTGLKASGFATLGALVDHMLGR